jgi:hypothetical protein
MKALPQNRNEHMNHTSESNSVQPAKKLLNRFNLWADGELHTPEPSVGERVRYRDGLNKWRYVYGHLKESGSKMVIVALDSGRDACIPKGWIEGV